MLFDYEGAINVAHSHGGRHAVQQIQMGTVPVLALWLTDRSLKRLSGPGVSGLRRAEDP